jgi:tRNA(fMet)-specific endonuclease VapC
MVILDTDHFSLLQFPESATRARLMARLKTIDPRDIATTVVTYEEQLRGWLGEIAGAKTSSKEIQAYRQLNRNLDDFCKSRVLEFEEQAAAELQRLRRMKIRIGTMDLKIASITLVHDATLLSRNLVHFKKVPGLKVEDWTA